MFGFILSVIITLINIIIYLYKFISLNLDFGLFGFLARIISLSLFYYLRPELAYAINSTILDGFDSYLRPKQYNTKDEWTKTNSYQFQDKITDNIMRLVALYFKSDLLLIFLFIYRSIGEMLFYLTEDSKFLFYFMDFFQIFYIADLFGDYSNLFIVSGIIGKIFLEYAMHYKQMGGMEIIYRIFGLIDDAVII